MLRCNIGELAAYSLGFIRGYWLGCATWLDVFITWHKMAVNGGYQYMDCNLYMLYIIYQDKIVYSKAYLAETEE